MRDDLTQGRWHPESLPPLHVAAFWTAAALINAWFAGWIIFEFFQVGPSASDWAVFESAADAVKSGQSPYTEQLFRWSPLAAYLLVPITLLPFWLWAALHVAAIALLPDRRIILLLLVSFPFLQDLSFGNMLTFSFVAGWFALRGGVMGTWSFLALALLVPRPLYIPILVWIVWKRPAWRVPLAIVAATYAVLVMGSGWAGLWLDRLLASSDQVAFAFNFGPSRWLGTIWLVVALPCAAWLLSRGRVGWATLFASPYWLLPYFMFPLLELGRRPETVDGSLRARVLVLMSRWGPRVNWPRRFGWVQTPMLVAGRLRPPRTGNQ